MEIRPRRAETHPILAGVMMDEAILLPPRGLCWRAGRWLLNTEELNIGEKQILEDLDLPEERAAAAVLGAWEQRRSLNGYREVHAVRICMHDG